MCTVTWLSTDQGFELFCSRDEKRTRALAHGPEKRYRDGVAFVAPLDGESQGTWIAVNEFGLALCLLNGRTSPVDLHSPLSSRGSLILRLVDCRGPTGVLRRLQRMALQSYPGFLLLLLKDGEGATLMEWEGGELEICRNGATRMPLVSSSYHFDEAVRVRTRLFSEMLSRSGAPTAAMLESFHFSHAPEAGPFSICMHRADARTHSLSRVSVGSTKITLTYWNDSPCQAASPFSVSLARGPKLPMSVLSTAEPTEPTRSRSRQPLC